MLQAAVVRRYGTAAIAEAAAQIAAGHPVAIATETVYGLAADATSGEAVARVFAAKGRPGFNPLIVHVADLASAQAVGSFNAEALALAEANWPGPLTLVVPLAPGHTIATLATAGLGTVAIRVPVHRAIRALLAATGVPLAAPSANASGSISPTTAGHVLASLGDRIGLIIDDGPCEVGIESTIVAATGNELRLLRAGPIQIAQPQTSNRPTIEAPGQLASHYSPTKPVRLAASEALADEFLIGFGPIAGDWSLSPAGDLIEAAARLFAGLHVADASGASRIAVAPVPATGIGIAINDRLMRAAA